MTISEINPAVRSSAILPITNLAVKFRNLTHTLFIEPLSVIVRNLIKTVNWVIENRGGFACLIGLMIVPAQFLCPKAHKANRIIETVSKNSDSRIKKFKLQVKDSGTFVKGIVYYPKNWNEGDRSHCVLYHNPNAVTVAEYFSTLNQETILNGTLGSLFKLHNCPIIMYDYRGTGLSSENRGPTFFKFSPTYETIVADGEAALDYALANFESVTNMGCSLGGAVATVSLARHLNSKPRDTHKVTLISHDSFSTTPKVVLPNWPRFGSWLGWILGGLLNAEDSMQMLIEKKISITVLCHKQDPVIPAQASMAAFIEKLPTSKNVSITYSPIYAHASLTSDLIEILKNRARSA